MTAADRAVVLAACALAIVASLSAASPRTGPRPRCFRPRTWACSKGPDRDAWQKPDPVMDALGIAERSAVADVGAGGGWFTVRLARRVGPNGMVYAQDVQQQMLEAISRRVEREGFSNVVYVAANGSTRGCPRGARRGADRRRVPRVRESRGAAARFAAALKPGGRLGIVNFSMDGGGPGPPISERVEEERVVEQAARAGLRCSDGDVPRVSVFPGLRQVITRIPGSGDIRSTRSTQIF